MATKLLIYDGQCAYCRGFARLARALDFSKKFALLPFESEPAQRLLRAQFGADFGFAMFLFEEDSVSWGRAAAQRIVQSLRLPGARLAFWLYPTIVSIVSRLTRRHRKVCGPGCAADGDALSAAPLTKHAQAELSQLLLSL
jgi:predicted DCC family thiol-disulfide oxidoreductase YuxK